MIIHNAWRLDFNLSLASFESHAKGSRILMGLARSSQHSSSIRYLFTSSIGETQSWDAQTLGPYPEEVVMNAKYAVGGGYGESKYVTERVSVEKSRKTFSSYRIRNSDIGKEWTSSDLLPDWTSYRC
jgi:thioester reductase-like protein